VLSGSNVAGGDLVFVGGEGCQYFGLLARRDLEEVQGPSEFGTINALAMVLAVPTSRAASLRRRRHPVGGGRSRRQITG
jgi:hypothetical protein